MSRPFRLSVALSAIVTTALAGALLSAPTTAYAETYKAPPASHAKECKKAGFAGSRAMRLQSSKKAIGKSGRTKVTARAWVYSNTKNQVCVVTAANSPRVKKTKKTTAISYGGSMVVTADATIRFEGEGHVLNSPEAYSDSTSFSRWGRKAPKTLRAAMIDLPETGTLSAEDVEGLPEELQSLEGKSFRMDATSLEVSWELAGTRTSEVKKVKKAKAEKKRRAAYKKIAARRAAGLKKATATWKKWTAAQPQNTPEERAWVKLCGEMYLELAKSSVKIEAKHDKWAARQAAREAVEGIKTTQVYDIKINMPLTLPRLG